MGKLLLAALAATTSVLGVGTADARPRWTEAQARAWYARQPWLVGANYTPASAINQLEMWQAATWDPKRIDHELGLAQGIGMNTMRVFLHDQLLVQDPEGFKRRIDAFLTIAQAHGIRQKKSAGVAPHAEIIEEYKASCDVIVAGVGD